jgi:type IV pilus assembly protein PilA
MQRNNGGFSLIELLIVVAIILIIAAIAIPSLLRSRIAANQAAAVGCLRTINTVLVAYASTYNTGYSSDLSDLGGTAGTISAAGLIDSVLAGTGNSSVKSGYTFVYAASAADASGHINGYTINADPESVQTGTNHYYTDATMVIRVNSTQAAGPNDNPIGG